LFLKDREKNFCFVYINVHCLALVSIHTKRTVNKEKEEIREDTPSNKDKKKEMDITRKIRENIQIDIE